MATDTRSALTLEVKARLDRLLEERVESHADIIRHLGLSVSGYYGMWKEGTMPLATMLQIADYLKVHPSRMLSAPAGDHMVGEPLAPYARPRYLEERIADLEREMREVRQQLPKKPKPTISP